jgi:hypothetical protein
MWSVFTIIGYFVLALVIPTAWMALSVRRRTAAERRVLCPRDGVSSLVKLDSWYAVRMHALGNPELLVGQCSRWPGYAGCGQECREEMATRG